VRLFGSNDVIQGKSRSLPGRRKIDLEMNRQSFSLVLFIMWIANREELNSAFQRNHAALEWLKPFPPGIGLVGPGGDVTNSDELATAIVNRASQFGGRSMFRRFKVER